jgi:drug/metabolite transporter (DMT)-like permease
MKPPTPHPPKVSRTVNRISRRSRTTDLALLSVAVVWGSSYVAAKDVVTADSVFSFLVIRFAVAAVGLAILLAPRLRSIKRSEVFLGVAFGAILSAVFILETFGVTGTSASNAGLIIALTIVMTPILQRCLGHTHLPPMFYAASALAVCGVALLTQRAGFAAPGLGDLLILLAAVARAVHVTAIARLSAGRSVDSARVTLIQFCTALSLFVILSQITGQGIGEAAAQMGTRSWLITVYLALGCTVFAFFIQIWAVRRTSPARVSLLLGTEPLWASAIGIFLAGDQVTLLGVAGAVLILIGTNWGRAIETRRDSPAKRHPSPGTISLRRNVTGVSSCS